MPHGVQWSMQADTSIPAPKRVIPPHIGSPHLGETLLAPFEGSTEPYGAQTRSGISEETNTGALSTRKQIKSEDEPPTVYTVRSPSLLFQALQLLR